jgi:hypothetical protein
MTLLLRTLTLKSKIGFGHSEYKDLTVQEFITLKKEVKLINFYYNLSMINFSKDVLEILGIDKEFIIEKPGKNKNLEKQAVNRFYQKMDAKQALIHRTDNLKTREHDSKRRLKSDGFMHSKSELRRINNGKHISHLK